MFSSSGCATHLPLWPFRRFEKWSDGVDIQKSQKTRVMRSLHKSRRRGLVECWETWEGLVARRHAARAYVVRYVETRKWRLDLQLGFGQWRAAAAMMAPARVKGDVCKVRHATSLTRHLTRHGHITDITHH